MEVKAVSVAGNACLCPQIILEDSAKENILVAAGNVIQSVQISSGLLNGTYRSHQDLVSAMCTVKSSANNTLVVSASFDGNIDLWNPESFETLKLFQVHRPVIKMFCVPFWIEKTDEKSDVSSSTKVDFLIILARSSNPEKKSFDILKISVSDLLSGQNNFSQFGSTLTPRLDSFAFDTTLSASNGSSSFKTYYALVANGKKGLNFLICAERENLSAQQSSVYFSLNDPVIAFATNMSSGSIAVGHDNGQLSVLTNVVEFLRQFWQLGQKRSSEVLVASHHWHAHPVMSLCFSPDGSLLYSGGEENVLVIWDLKNAGRNYLPRLGAPISRIISCQSIQRAGHVLITTVDNAVRLVNIANFEIEWLWQSANISTSINSFQQNKQPKASSTGDAKSAVSAQQQRLQLLRSLQSYRFHEDHAERSWFAQCLINPRTGNLLINGNPGIMQEFDFYNGIIRQNHPLLQHHRVSRKDPGMRMFLPSITRFAVDSSGRLLVTIDVKRGEEQPKEYSLKIWEWFPENESDYIGAGQYRIVAQLDKPHGDYPVTCLTVSQRTYSAVEVATASNEQLLQSVMIATGSNDGTIKMWTRKQGDDVQDMYTSAIVSTNTTANSTSSNQPGSKNGSNQNANASTASTNANNKKQYALHKLRWKCHYAFTYRLAPVLAATFSVDSSLLIVAHENLITCWDPQTVALRASLTLSVPRKIIFLSVIEPRAAADYGQGVGDVYLVAATNVSVSVFSLLTLQQLWSLEGDNIEIEAIATANSESFAMSDHVDAQHHHHFQSTLAEEGWIAVATSSSSAALASSPVTVAADSIQQLPHHQQHNVSVFSPVSSKPILQEQVSLSSKITSLTFLRRHFSSGDVSTVNKPAVMGLAALTADSDVWVIQPSQHICTFQPGVTAMVGAKAAATMSLTARSSTSSGGPTVAQVKTPKLPKVSFNKDASLLQIDAAGDLSSHIVAPMKSVAPMGRALASKDWLRSLLPECTEDLPRISDIAGSYLRSMMDNSVPVVNNSIDNDVADKQQSNVLITNGVSSKTIDRPVASMSVKKLPHEETEELLRRVSAKWDSVLGKRSATVAAISHKCVDHKDSEKTPAKKSRKDTEQDVAATTPVASKVATTEKSSKSASKKTPSKSKDLPVESEVGEEEEKNASKKRSSSKKAVPALVAESVLPPVPEDEEVQTASSTAAVTAIRSSSRKRKESDLSSVASETEDDKDDDDSTQPQKKAATATRSSSRKSLSKLETTAIVEDGNMDDDVASVATDVTTPSVASARRSARQKANSFVTLASVAPATVASSSAEASATRSTRNRK